MVGELYADKGIDIAQLEQISQSGFGNTLTLIACATGYQSAGVDLAQFNSVASAKDIAAVAQAMGYQGEYNLYGTSYGTRLALNALRSTPDKIRAVILDGTAGPSMPNNAYTTAKIQDQYDSFFAQCRASDLCNMRYPNLRDRFISVLKDLKARPLVFSEPVVTSDYLRPFLGVLEKIDPAFFADMGRITNVAAQGGYVGVLPAIIAALENREERALRKLLGGGVLPPAAPIDQIASADDVLAADDMFLQTAIDVVLARAKAETDESSLSDQWASLVINELDSRLRGGETQATVIRDLVELTLVPIKGTDAAALNEFARSHLSDLSATKAEALVGGMDRQQVRETMWAIQDVAAVLLGVGERSGALGVATGAMFAVNCAEDISLVPEEVAAEYMAASPYPGVFVNSLKDYRGSRIACSFFPTPFTREEMMTPVKSVKPALIFQEGLDSQTPLTFGKKVAANLPNSFFLEWPSEGHVIATRSRDGCAGDIAAAFMDRPDQQPDFGCSEDPYYSIQFEMAFGKVDEMLAQPD